MKKKVKSRKNETSQVKNLIIILLAGLSGAGIYSGGKQAYDFWRTWEPPRAERVKKVSAVKPKFLKQGEYRVRDYPAPEEFTFFETLNDSAMVKFVGLKGGVVPRQEERKEKESTPVSTESSKVRNPSPHREPNPAAKADPGSAPPPPEAVSPLSRPSETVERDSADRYRVQVGSFRKLDRARFLMNRLRERRYPAYLTQVLLPQKGGLWHRVIVGDYPDLETAQTTARTLRKRESLNPAIVRQAAGPHPS